MKLFLKILGCIILTVIVALYLAFLFYLPKAIDLNTFKPEIQKLAKEQGNVDVNFENLHIITDPLLRVGVIADNISVKLPDGSSIFTTNYIKGKLSLPNLLLLTVKLVDVEVDTPLINLEVENGKQLKVMQFVEDLINEQKRAAEEKTEIVQTEASMPFDISIIKIKVPDVKINDYKVLVNDIKNKHTLTLLGEELNLGYFNGKTFKFKTMAKLYSDDDEKIMANVNLDVFIPPASTLDADDDEAERIELPQLNPVQMYRDYDLKTSVNMKLKARNGKKGLCLGGFVNVENLTMMFSGYQLPESYAKINFRGKLADMDTDIYLTPDENIKLKGILSYTGNPFMNLKINTSTIYFADVLTLAKAFAETLQIKNDLNSINAEGYINANADIKTDFKKLKSDGAIIIRDGAFLNNSIGLGFSKMNANLLFANNTFKISDTHMFINDSALNLEGTINEKNVTDISILADKLPLPQLFLAFAPSDLKKSYNLQSGYLSLNVKIFGELKDALSTIKVSLDNFHITDKQNSLIVQDENADIDLSSDFRTIGGKIINNNFKLTLPQSSCVISDDLITVNIDEENIKISPTNIKINSDSVIKFKGAVKNYIKNPEINLSANGKLAADDMKQFAYPFGDIFLKSKGAIPVKLSLTGNSKRQHLILQAMADKLNHITPVDIQSIAGKQSMLQAKVDFKGNRLRIKDTGLYYKDMPTAFTDDLSSNMQGAKEVFGLSTTITGLDAGAPFINLMKITMPEELTGSIYAFKDSLFNVNGNMIVFGNLVSPYTRGRFQIHDVSIPDLMTTLETVDLNFSGKHLDVDVNNLNLNGSDIAIKTRVELIPSSVVNISNLSVISQLIDLDKLMLVSDAAMKYVPQTPSPSSSSQTSADIPVLVRRGDIDLKQIKTGDIKAYNTTGHIALRDNVFYLNELATTAFNGHVTGNVSANLLTMALKLKLHGTNFDVENTLLELMQMKDTLSGMLTFDTDLTMDGAAANEIDQMKSIAGTVDFVIEDGQLGPFGKLENLILAENIRESEFFKTTIGSVINSITSINTSHFNELSGHLLFNEGVLTIDPITSFGDVLCMNIGGNMNLLNNEADMTLRAKLGSTVSNMLGPLAAVNPINLVKVTPGMDVMAAKAFQFFCEEVTQEEMDAIPEFGKNFNEMSTTKFQVIIQGDTTKPLTLVKSFKWLALSSDIEQAQSFVSELPDPEPTPEELQAAKDKQRIEESRFWRFIYWFRPSKRDLLNGTTNKSDTTI